MSNHHRMQVNSSREARRLAEQERQRRQEQIKRRQRELERLRELQRQQQVLSQQQQKLQHLQGQLKGSEQNISQLKSQVEWGKASLQHSAEQVASSMSKARRIQAETQSAIAEVSRLIKESTQKIGEIQDEIVRNIDRSRGLGIAQLKGEALAVELANKTAQLQQLERELKFVTQNADLQVETMITMMAMRSNGYVLRNTLSKEGLIAYFDKVDGSHQVAVRHRKPSAFSHLWELEAETFAVKGEACLDIMEDFVDGLEETEAVEVQLKSRRYPKRDGTGLPIPRKRAKDHRGTLSSLLGHVQGGRVMSG